MAKTSTLEILLAAAFVGFGIAGTVVMADDIQKNTVGTLRMSRYDSMRVNCGFLHIEGIKARHHLGYGDRNGVVLGDTRFNSNGTCKYRSIDIDLSRGLTEGNHACTVRLADGRTVSKWVYISIDRL